MLELRTPIKVTITPDGKIRQKIKVRKKGSHNTQYVDELRDFKNGRLVCVEKKDAGFGTRFYGEN